MAVNQYISVKVCGNPDSNSGFVPILLFNSPSFAVEDQFYVGFDNCSYFYTIKTTKTQTIYKLVKNNVRSFGAARAGSLVIAFSVPKNYVIEGGYTPYDVLEKLKNEFLKKCMTCKDPVRETYEFNSGRIDQHVLDEVACEFTISPQPSPDRIMNPNAPKGYVVKSDAEIEKMFHDLNYPEFDNYSEVVVAESVNQTSYTPINNIQIPRPKSYAVFVDGVFKMSCADLTKMLTVSSNSSPEYYENKSVHFTIQNLKDGDIIPGIELQEVNERINISTQGWATPRRRTIGLKIVPAEFESYFFTNKHLLKLRWPFGTIQLDQNLSFTLEGEQIGEIKKGTIRLELEQNGKFTLSKSAIYGDEFRVTVEEIKRQISPNLQGAGQHRYQQQEKVTDLQVVKSSPVYDVSIFLMGKEKFESGNEIDVKLKTHPEKSNITLATCRTRFKAMSKSNDAFEGHFYVPKELGPNLYLYFQVNDKKYMTKQPLYLSNEKGVVKDEDFEISNVEPFYKKRHFLIKLLTLLLGILLGFIIGFVSHNGIKSLFEVRNTEDVTPTPFDGYKNTSMTEDEAVNFLKDADDKLKQKDLVFSNINELYKTYNDNKNTIDSVDEKKFDNKICDRIEAYHTVISFITNGDTENLKKVIDDYDYNPNNYHIWPQHVKLIKQIFKDESTVELFRNNYSNITGFDNIEENMNNNDNQEDIRSASQQTVTPPDVTQNGSPSTKKPATTRSTTEKKYWDCEKCKNAGKKGYRYDDPDQYKNHLKSHQER